MLEGTTKGVRSTNGKKSGDVMQISVVFVIVILFSSLRVPSAMQLSSLFYFLVFWL